MKGKFLGIIILAAVVIAAIAIKLSGVIGGPAITLKGYVGGEKIGLLEDEEVIKILKSRYGIKLDYAKAGSIEMVKEEKPDADFLFPSSQVALEIFKAEKGSRLVKSEIIINSPIVIYSWTEVAQALEKDGVVEKRDNTYYITDFPRLLQYMVEGKKWSDIGLPQLYDGIKIMSTDPNKSNSGNMFSGLAANVLNGEVVDMATLNTIMPDLKTIFTKMGYMEHSSGNMFEGYLSKGLAMPLVVGYENQMVEFALEEPETWKDSKDMVAVLYPEPTVWSSHPLIALNENGVKLIHALMDEELQQIAWKKHGFRSGLLNVKNDKDIIDITGIPQGITKVVPMPTAEVMMRIMEALLQ